jgi:hypothetical protein
MLEEAGIVDVAAVAAAAAAAVMYSKITSPRLPKESAP